MNDMNCAELHWARVAGVVYIMRGMMVLCSAYRGIEGVRSGHW